MKYRKLRIAWSVAWGVVAVLLCMLWVRSYTVADSLALDGRNRVTVVAGRIYLNEQFQVSENAIMPYPRPNGVGIPQGVGGGSGIWPILVIASTLATFPWIRWRFSLRTLLIATTLVAVALGLIVWASR
jgi:hypothetical protein